MLEVFPVMIQVQTLEESVAQAATLASDRDVALQRVDNLAGYVTACSSQGHAHEVGSTRISMHSSSCPRS